MINGRSLLRLHHDDRGNLGILMLFTLWILVVLLAMVWNAGDGAAHRRQAQSAADATALSAATWTSRSTNIIAATNLLIVQNASAEVVWRAYHDTAVAVEQRLASDLRRIHALADRVQRERERNNARPQGPDPVVELKLRLEQECIDAALASLGEQNAMFAGWVGPVASSLLTMTASSFRERRNEIHDYQRQIARGTPSVVDQQRFTLRDFYQCDLTYALPLRPSRPHEPSRRVPAPVKLMGGTNVKPIHVASVTVQPADPEDRAVRVRGGRWGEIDCPPLARYYQQRLKRDLGDDARVRERGLALGSLDDLRQQLGQTQEQILTAPPDLPRPLQRAYEEAGRDVQRMRLGQRFAFSRWANNADIYRTAVLHQLGKEHQYVLATYGRYSIPEWARPSVFQKVYDRVYRDVVAKNPGGPETIAGAAMIAQEVATHWIQRSWPYEIRPPAVQPPPNQGLSRSDRLGRFTLVVGAKTRTGVGPPPLLPSIFPDAVRPAAAFAQAETFNWMEYHPDYGGGDQFDHMFPPRPWRVSTVGGWNWRPRISLCDSLGPTLEHNAEFRSFMRQSGVHSYDPRSIDQITLH